MAKRKSARVTKSGGTTIVTVPAAAPLARRRRSSRRVARRRGAQRRRSSRSSRSGGSYTNKLLGTGAGGFAVGLIEKTFPNMPTLPFVGRKGAIAIAAYFLHGKHPLIADIGIAAAAISGYELGTTGHVTGDVMGDGTLASQM